MIKILIISVQNYETSSANIILNWPNSWECFLLVLEADNMSSLCVPIHHSSFSQVNWATEKYEDVQLAKDEVVTSTWKWHDSVRQNPKDSYILQHVVKFH